jgi:Chaperone of endosialidase
MKTTTLSLKSLMNRVPCWLALLLIPVAIACFGLSPAAQAVNPPPDGGYPGGNTAEGEDALFNLSTGSANTAIGFHALFGNTIGLGNTAVGNDALSHNTQGRFNTAVGFQSLVENTTGEANTATGRSALAKNTTGEQNTADGAFTLINNTTGESNTAVGFNTLDHNTTGSANTAVGHLALNDNTIGSGNVALGFQAGKNATTGFRNVYIGTDVQGVPGETNTCYIASIFGQTSADGVPVLINRNDKLGTATSSKRFKEDIKPMDKSSEALYSLKPVSFRYKSEIDPTGTSRLGLVAEDVEKVNRDLVVRDKEGKPYSVRYDQVNAMLLNEFLKEHGKVEKLEATVAQQRKDFEAVVAEFKGQIQKVSGQLELSKPAPQTVLNDQ